jgi:5'-nucleotidase / UDP-sugar diphosphatase
MKALKVCIWAGVISLVLLSSACIFGNVTVTILETSDVHNHACGYGPSLDYTPLHKSDKDAVLGGYARLAGLIDKIRKEQALKQIPVLVFDSGDYFMGTVYDMTAKNSKGAAALQFFSKMKYDAITLGNHEFDWTPAGLAQILLYGKTAGFNVPIVASNMTVASTNLLYGFVYNGTIVNKKVINFPYGLKIGVMGLMGPNANQDAPTAAPDVTFSHDYTASGVIQQTVNDLRNNDQVQMVVALSHGGIELDRSGDDKTLADSVSGIDVICSGHYHTATPSAFVEGASKTLIFEPGAYGEYLSRIDITYNVFLKKIVDYKYTLIPVNDTVKGDPAIDDMVAGYQSDLNTSLSALGISLTDQIADTSKAIQDGTTPLPPYGTGESGLGDLAADALLNVANSLAPVNNGDSYDFSVVAGGVIRDSIFPGFTDAISFTDIYNVLPLGISPDTDQPVLGYPLISFYVTGADLMTICEAGLTIGPSMGSDYYLNFGGLAITYNPNLAKNLMGVTGVTLLNGKSFDPAKRYHGVVDLYAIEMMGIVTEKLIQAGTGQQIIPLNQDGTPMTDFMANRIVTPMSFPTATGKTDQLELKEWMALWYYLDGMPSNYKTDISMIYGKANGLGRISMVNN